VPDNFAHIGLLEGHGAEHPFVYHAVARAGLATILVTLGGGWEPPVA